MGEPLGRANDWKRYLVHAVTPQDLIEQLRRKRNLTLHLKVIPKSSRNEIVGILDDGTVKLKVTAAPEKGKANAAVCEFLADFFGVAKRNVEIIRGGTSTSKHATVRM